MSAALATTPITNTVDQGARELGLVLSADALQSLEAYLDLIVKWNAVHNLTAIRDKARMVTHHVLDSLALVPYVPNGARVLDVGSGAGLPGIPLAIARSDLVVTLLDSNQKKAAFLQQAVTTLRLTNVTALAARVEQYRPAASFDIVLSRAFAEIGEFAGLAQGHVAPGGKLFAMKGVYPEDELRRMPANISVEQVVELHVPGLDAKRHLIVLSIR